MNDDQGAQDMKLRRTIDDEDRLGNLREYDILDTAPEAEYDRLAELIHAECRMNWAAITLVDRDRQWFKARRGFDLTETPRVVSFCSVAMHLNQPLVVEDARRDRRFAHNPLVNSDPHLRFYAGFSLVSDEGHPLGAVCVIDMEPRTLFPSQLNLLSRARDWVQASLDLRRLNRAVAKAAAMDASDLARSQQLRRFAQFRVDESWERITAGSDQPASRTTQIPAFVRDPASVVVLPPASSLTRTTSPENASSPRR